MTSPDRQTDMSQSAISNGRPTTPPLPRDASVQTNPVTTQFDGLVQAIRDYEWKLVPDEIEKLKKSNTIDGKDVINIRVDSESKKSKRTILHFMSYGTRPRTTKELTIQSDNTTETLRLRAVKALIEFIPNKDRSRENFINEPDEQGWTALHFAALNRQSSFAEYLIQQKANLEAKTKAGCTPLHFAAANRHGNDVSKALINSGADVNSEDQLRSTPLHKAAVAPSSDTTELLLLHMSGKDRFPFDDNALTPVDMARLLEKRGFTIDPGTGETSRLEDTTREKLKHSILKLQGHDTHKHCRSSSNPDQSSSSPTCSLHVVHINKADPLKADGHPQSTTIGVSQSRKVTHTDIPNKPISELLEEPAAWLKEFRSRQLSCQDSDCKDKPSLSCWIHLPANNVC